MLQLGTTEGIETKASVGKDREQEQEESPYRIRTPGYPPVTLLPAPGDVKEPPPPPSAVSPPVPSASEQLSSARGITLRRSPAAASRNLRSYFYTVTELTAPACSGQVSSK